ncbi:ATP-binding cassette domain-containing protein, partial [Aeromonas enteropelogenes]
EPTNHLDIEAINWLEEFLKDFRGAIVFISHDREFIHKLATRIIDLDRGVITSWPGNYDEYLQGKEEWLRVEELKNAEFDRKLAQEEVWVRQGIKARRTRNEGRVRALKAMRMERTQRRELQGKAKLQLDEAGRSGKLVFEAEGLGLDFGERTLFQGLDLQVLRGDKIALVGPNGCGKSTLIKLLLGQIDATRGSVRQGTNLEVAYFDQYREQLDPEKTVVDNVGEGKQEVMVRGRSRHILGYLQDFLFEPKRARTPVKALSGGEKNRLLLAKLFLKPSNLLILDEPTNDLDVETLELLEELLADYPGTLLLVSHDRRFIDNTVTGCWLFEGDGRISDYVGGYADMMATRAQQQAALQAKSAPSKAPEPVVVSEAPKKSKKLSYKLQLELDGLPARLEQLEAELEALQGEINQPGFFSLPSDQTQPKLDALNAAEAALEEAFARWEELEGLKNQE